MNEIFLWIVFLLFEIPIALKLYKDIKDYRKKKRLNKLWKDVKKAYEKDDFGSINKALKKIKKLENDPLILLLEIEKYLYGKTVYKDWVKVLELLQEIDKLQPPPKTPFETGKYTKNLAAKSKKTKAKSKKEDYLKKIKAKAREIWNEYDFWKLKKEVELFKNISSK